MPRRSTSKADGAAPAEEAEVDEAEFLETIGEPEAEDAEHLAKTETVDAELEAHLAKADEAAPGGAYVVNGVLVNANGEAI